MEMSKEEVRGWCGVETIRLPAKSPNLNSFAERWVRSVCRERLGGLLKYYERAAAMATAGHVWQSDV